MSQIAFTSKVSFSIKNTKDATPLAMPRTSAIGARSTQMNANAEFFRVKEQSISVKNHNSKVW